MNNKTRLDDEAPYIGPDIGAGLLGLSPTQYSVLNNNIFSKYYPDFNSIDFNEGSLLELIDEHSENFSSQQTFTLKILAGLFCNYTLNKSTIDVFFMNTINSLGGEVEEGGYQEMQSWYIPVELDIKNKVSDSISTAKPLTDIQKAYMIHQNRTEGGAHDPYGSH